MENICIVESVSPGCCTKFRRMLLLDDAKNDLNVYLSHVQLYITLLCKIIGYESDKASTSTQFLPLN